MWKIHFGCVILNLIKLKSGDFVSEKFNKTYLGIELDAAANEIMRRGKEGEISTANSKVKVFVLPTNEELVIARDTKAIVEAM